MLYLAPLAVVAAAAEEEEELDVLHVDLELVLLPEIYYCYLHLMEHLEPKVAGAVAVSC